MYAMKLLLDLDGETPEETWHYGLEVHLETESGGISPEES